MGDTSLMVGYNITCKSTRNVIARTTGGRGQSNVADQYARVPAGSHSETLTFRVNFKRQIIYYYCSSVSRVGCFFF